VRALALCTGTTTFSYTSQVDILPSFFTPLARLPHLRYLHVWASNLTQAQADVLAQLRGAPLETLILDKPTAAVLDVLPRWVAHIAELRTLSIYVCSANTLYLDALVVPLIQHRCRVISTSPS
jgi:hypothetical protein